MSSPLQPSMRLLITVGSIAIYAQRQCKGPLGVDDQIALDALLKEPELSAWLEQMDRLAALPVKR